MHETFCCGVLLALLLLSGCGYKAPLELPQSAVDTPADVMSFSRNTAGVLCVEGLSLADIADKYGTPCYVYSKPRWLRPMNALSRHSRKANRPCITP